MRSLNSQSTRDNKRIQNYPTCAISGHGRGGYIQVLYGKDLLGSSTTEALLNMVWFNNTIHFGFRGWKEHREMCWGDVNLCQTSTGQEYLEFNERETKTRSGNNPRNVRAIAPKMFALPNNKKCPVKAYKVYAEKWPAGIKTDDAPFYLAVNNVKSGSVKPWFKKAPVGVNISSIP